MHENCSVLMMNEPCNQGIMPFNVVGLKNNSFFSEGHPRNWVLESIISYNNILEEPQQWRPQPSQTIDWLNYCGSYQNGYRNGQTRSLQTCKNSHWESNKFGSDDHADMHCFSHWGSLEHKILLFTDDSIFQRASDECRVISCWLFEKWKQQISE